MLTYVVNVNGEAVFPDAFNEAEWQLLKNSFRAGDFLTPCCKTAAVPKTSMYGVQFFSHISVECATSPESIWHISSKDRIARELGRLGLRAILEQPANGTAGARKSDVYFELLPRRIAIEVQRSYQHLDDYLRRQEKYSAHGIECYWLLYKSRYLTIVKSIVQRRIKREFGGKIPSSGVPKPCIAVFPMVLFEPEVVGGTVRGAGGFRVSIAGWLESLVQGSFVLKDGIWRIT